MLRAILGILMMVSGVVGGLYLGVWVMFIGGIVDIATFAGQIITDSVIQESLLAFGVLKFLLASIVGWFFFWVVFGTGFLTFLGWSV